MDLFDILLIKKLVGKINPGEITSPEIQIILEQLEQKVSEDEMKKYVEGIIENIPTRLS